MLPGKVRAQPHMAQHVLCSQDGFRRPMTRGGSQGDMKVPSAACFFRPVGGAGMPVGCCTLELAGTLNIDTQETLLSKYESGAHEVHGSVMQPCYALDIFREVVRTPADIYAFW